MARHRTKASTKGGNTRGEYEAAEGHARSFDLSRVVEAHHQVREMPVFVAGFPDPSSEVVQKAVGNGKPAFIGADVEVAVESVDVKAGSDSSFGLVGPTVSVHSKASFVSGTLIVPLVVGEFAGVDTQSLRLFRWNDSTSEFEPLAVSRVALSGDYLWGRITVPGYYAAVGLPAHPLALRTVAILDTLAGLADAISESERQGLLRSVCGMLLGSADLQKLISSDAALASLRQESWLRGLPDPIAAWSPNPGFEAGDLVDRCPALPSFRTPESTLLPFSWSSWRRAPRVTCTDAGWESVGPVNIPGCTYEVAVDPSNTDRLYALASHGGVWTLPSVALYGDITWTPLTDNNDTLVTAAFAVAGSDERVLYLVDGLNRLLRSRDRGTTWNLTANPNVGSVWRMLVDPADANIVWLATRAGLMRSRDGGDTWDHADGEATMHDGDITDVVFDPTDPSIMYIGKRSVGLLKTSNGGTDWELLLAWGAATNPSGSMIKVALGHLGDDSNRTIAVRFDQEVLINRSGGRPQSSPGGGPWQSKGMVGGSGYGDWCHVIGVDPHDNDLLLAGAQELFRSSDGGSTWTNVVGEYSEQHADQHRIAYDTEHRGVVYVANDGGVIRSSNGGETWQPLHWGLITGQLFLTGIQGTHAVTAMDHHGIQTTSNIQSRVWAGPGGGGWEWARVYADPKRADTYYMRTEGSPGAADPALRPNIAKYRWPSTTDQDFTNPLGSPQASPMASGNQVSPVAVDTRDDSGTVLVGTEPPGRVMRTTDVAIASPAWAPVAGIAVREGVASVAYAPSRPGSAYAISANGTVFHTDDANHDAAWTQVGQWNKTGVEELAINSGHDDRLYAVAEDEIARSETSGATWISIGTRGDGNLPDSPFRAVVAHPFDGQTIFLGTEIGVFISHHEGATWLNYNQGLPHAIVDGMLWDSGYLYAVTYGRGLWRRQVCM